MASDRYRRQTRIQKRSNYISDFIRHLARANAGDAIPRFDRVSGRLYARTRWRLVAVGGERRRKVFFDLRQTSFSITGGCAL